VFYVKHFLETVFPEAIISGTDPYVIKLNKLSLTFGTSNYYYVLQGQRYSHEINMLAVMTRLLYGEIAAAENRKQQVRALLLELHNTSFQLDHGDDWVTISRNGLTVKVTFDQQVSFEPAIGKFGTLVSECIRNYFYAVESCIGIELNYEYTLDGHYLRIGDAVIDCMELQLKHGRRTWHCSCELTPQPFKYSNRQTASCWLSCQGQPSGWCATWLRQRRFTC